MRKKAAQEISKALRHREGNYKIVFVVTEEAGRVRPADGVTMALVLDALPDKKTPYGIVVNKMSKHNIQRLDSEESNKREFLVCLNEGRDNKTAFIHLYPKREELDDQENAVHEPEGTFIQFLDLLPSVLIKPKEVKEIKTGEYDKRIEFLEEKINKLLQDKGEQDRQFELIQGQLADQMKKNKDLEQQLAAPMNQPSPLDVLMVVLPFILMML
jgi:hypothetical protein